MVGGHHPEAPERTDWLEAPLHDPDLRNLECTTYLRPVAGEEHVRYHPDAGRAD